MRRKILQEKLEAAMAEEDAAMNWGIRGPFWR